MWSCGTVLVLVLVCKRNTWVIPVQVPGTCSMSHTLYLDVYSSTMYEYHVLPYSTVLEYRILSIQCMHSKSNSNTRATYGHATPGNENP